MSEEEKYEQLRQVCLSYRNEIADLEAKLAESEKKLKEYATEITRRNTEQLDMQTRSFLKIRDLDTQILILKQQLAESEKQNKDLEDDHNKLIDQYDKQYNDLCKEIQFHSSARERFVKKVKELEQQLAEKEEQYVQSLIKLEKEYDEQLKKQAKFIIDT